MRGDSRQRPKPGLTRVAERRVSVARRFYAGTERVKLRDRRVSDGRFTRRYATVGVTLELFSRR